MKKVIKDIIPVIIGILIALLINNWNEDRKEKKYLDQIFTAINSELEESVLDLKDVLPKQQILIDSLGRYLNDETITIYEIIKRAGGVHGSSVKNNSWKAIANTKIELVEFQKLSALTEITESQEFINLKREKLLDFMIDNLISTNKDKKEVFKLLCEEMNSSEKFLLSEIEKFLIAEE